MSEAMNDLWKNLSKKHMQDLAIIWWNVWYARNKKIFRNENIDITEIGILINNQIQQWKYAKRWMEDEEKERGNEERKEGKSREGVI